MERLKTIIKENLLANDAINWFIIHDLSKSKIEIDDVIFSFVDGKEERDSPLNMNQGYLQIESSSVFAILKSILFELSIDFKGHKIQLSNLFILITRVSITNDEKEELVNDFCASLDDGTRQNIFDLLIDSLNSKYYKNNHRAQQNPSKMSEWLDLIHSAQYIHAIADPLLYCLYLVQKEHSRALKFDVFVQMKPLLRSVLIGFYGYKIEVSETEMHQIIENEYELTFLAAYLVDDIPTGDDLPSWASIDVIDSFINDYWQIIGSDFFINVFGISYRYRVDTSYLRQLKELLHEVLIIDIVKDDIGTCNWLEALIFPKDFIALFAWLSYKEIDYTVIPQRKKSALLKRFISELQRIVSEIANYMEGQTAGDPFNYYQLLEDKYQRALSHILYLFLIASDNDDLKNFKSVCFEFKPLFYGGFQSTYLAKKFSEIVIITGLSGRNCDGLVEGEILILKEYLRIITDTILLPYINLVERDDEIWNPDAKKEVFQYSAGSYIINALIQRIKTHPIGEYYIDFFQLMKDIQVAEWPYERQALL